MTRKLKILQLSPRFPFPLDDGGKIGIANIFINFKKLGAEPFLFCFKDDEINQSALDEAQTYGKVHIYPHIPKNSLHNALHAFATNKSLYICKHYSQKALDFLTNLCEQEHFDIIHCDHTAMARLGIELGKKFYIPVGLRLHNIEHLIWERYANHLDAINPLKLFAKQQAKALKKAEIELINKCDVCFTITHEEELYAKSLAPNAKIKLASIGVDLQKFFYVPAAQREQRTLVIATTYKWKPNVDGLLWFIENVMPIIKKELSGVKLNLYGKGLPEELKNYSHLGVCPVGYVPDIVPHLQKATLYIAPLFVGAGIRIKILEAMATGLPVVATSIAADGISASKTDGLIKADSAEETAKNIICLLKNHQMRAILGEAASKFVKNNFSWESNVSLMLQEYNKLLPSKRQITS